MKCRINNFKLGRIGLLILLATASGAFGSEWYVKETARDIPVIKQVDVLVIGGSSAGVAVAAQAANAGADVFLAAERPYLGQDLCRTYEMWVTESPNTELAKLVFGQLEAPAGLYSQHKILAEACRDRSADPPEVLPEGALKTVSSGRSLPRF